MTQAPDSPEASGSQVEQKHLYTHLHSHDIIL